MGKTKETANLVSNGFLTPNLDNGQLGIGTDIPQSPLEVQAGSLPVTIRRNGNVGDLINLRNNNFYNVIGGDQGSLYFKTNGTAGTDERLRITSAGLVGIGITNPDKKLVIAQANSTAYSGTDFDQDYHVLKLNNTTDSKTVGMQFLIGSNGEAAITATEASDGATDLIFGTRGGGSRAERLRITAAGLVGIGTDNPSKTLTVYGDSSSSFRISKSGVLAYDHTFDGSSYTIANNNGSAGIPIIIGTKTAGGESLRVDSSGRLLVGATSSYGSANSDDLTIGDRTQSEVGITLGATVASAIRFADAGNVSAGMIQYVHNSGGTDYLNFYTNGANERLRIDSSGNVNIGAKDYNTHNSTVDSLQIGYALNLYEDSYTSGNDNYLILANNARYAASGGNTYMRNDEAMRIYMNAGQFAYQNAPAGTAGNSITFTDRLLITSGGQVIVNGTTNLAHPNMDDIIVGDASGNRGITVASATDGYGTLAFGDSTDASGNDRYQGFVEYYHDDNSMRLGTVASERLRIVSNGDMRLGASSFGAPKTKLDIIEDQTIPFGVTANTGTFVGVMVRTRYYCEFSIEFPNHPTDTSIQLKFSRTGNAPSISIDYFSGGGYQVDHGVSGVAYISFLAASGATLYSGTNHQSAYGAATPSWSHGNGTTDVLFKLSNIAYTNGSMCHFRINIPRGGIDNITVDRTTP